MFRRRHYIVKSLLGLLVIVLFAGCATPTVESRKQERYAAYQALSPELKAAVDHGSIKAGMSMDAVYIAWGQPAQVLQGGNAGGESTTWLYEGGYLEETRYWGYRRVHYDYNPRSYVRAEIVFVNGVVKEWHTLPQPVY
ncbi:MAG: hypothetical protein JWR69_3349 [Pedosphaera sp.]|nr:hypothetical protein [Pedosphaera sp.]